MGAVATLFLNEDEEDNNNNNNKQFIAPNNFIQQQKDLALNQNPALYLIHLIRHGHSVGWQSLDSGCQSTCS